MYLYNTLTRKIEKFKPLNPPLVTFYTCGPTVYDYTHLGHMRTYVNNDLLKRTLIYLGYKVKHVMNITDVGHLTGDDDQGEDKLEKGAKREKKSVWEIAKFYTDYFFYTIDQLNIIRPEIICKATDHIKEMINLIKILEKKGFVYETNEAVYFNTKKFKNYGILNPQKDKEKRKGAREEVYVDPNKKNPADFALWFKRVGRFANHTMHWDSPWGDGFPGWHIECSAMSMKYLGETIDIHAGGIDHIPIHHTNEIAQSEAATSKQFVRFWFHNNFLLVEGKKMSKSLENFYTIDDIKKKKIEPLAIRYLFLQTHYRKSLNFTWQSAISSQLAYNELKEKVLFYKNNLSQKLNLEKIKSYQDKFKTLISNDLQIPKALAFVWEIIHEKKLNFKEKYRLILDFDKVLGLNLKNIKKETIPKEIINLAKQRDKARKAKDFKTADKLREEIEKRGYIIEDTKEGFVIKKNKIYS